MSTSSSSDGASRLNLLKGVAVAGVGLAAVGSSVADANTSTPTSAGKLTVDRLLTKDGTSLYFKDWGSGPAVVFSHGSSRSMPPTACSGSPFWSGLILKRNAVSRFSKDGACEPQSVPTASTRRLMRSRPDADNAGLDAVHMHT